MNESGGTVIQNPAGEGSPGDSGSGLEARLMAVEAGLIGLEAELKHVATKADLEAFKTDLERYFNRFLEWAIGIMIAATGALSAIIFGLPRMFGS